MTGGNGSADRVGTFSHTLENVTVTVRIDPHRRVIGLHFSMPIAGFTMPVSAAQDLVRLIESALAKLEAGA